MKTLLVLSCCALLAVSTAADVKAWGAITHTYFAHELGKGPGYFNMQEIYGATLPDMFNLMYGSPYKDYLWAETHNEFMKVVAVSCGRSTEAFAYGFASHNDVWGADYTAHHSARTDPAEGYVITKSMMLVPVLKPQIVDILNAAGVPDAESIAEALALGLAENFVETAVDILVRRNEDAAAGYRLLLAAQLRDFRIPFKLVQAYAADLAAVSGMSIVESLQFLYGAEREYRELMTMYGLLFTRSESETIALLAEQGAALAETYLKTETGFDVVVPQDVIVAFLAGVAIPAVEGDYGAEIAATLSYLEAEMSVLGAGAPVFPLAGGEDPGAETPGADGFALAQNYPNPFNPSTVIEYTLPEACRVRLAVYNAAGKQVDVLVDAFEREGGHSVQWNAAGLPSGIYFYRLQAGRLQVTRKMCLLR
jgi:hypothetical protein